MYSWIVYDIFSWLGQYIIIQIAQLSLLIPSTGKVCSHPLCWRKKNHQKPVANPWHPSENQGAGETRESCKPWMIKVGLLIFGVNSWCSSSRVALRRRISPDSMVKKKPTLAIFFSDVTSKTEAKNGKYHEIWRTYIIELYRTDILERLTSESFWGCYSMKPRLMTSLAARGISYWSTSILTFLLSGPIASFTW